MQSYKVRPLDYSPFYTASSGWDFDSTTPFCIKGILLWQHLCKWGEAAWVLSEGAMFDEVSFLHYNVFGEVLLLTLASKHNWFDSEHRMLMLVFAGFSF